MSLVISKLDRWAVSVGILAVVSQALWERSASSLPLLGQLATGGVIILLWASFAVLIFASGYQDVRDYLRRRKQRRDEEQVE